MKKQLILASGSPRRRELLAQAGFTFQIFTAGADESLTDLIPEEMVKELSARKADAAMEKWIREGHSSEAVVILGADTIVVDGNQILGKPKDREDARATLKMLQGRNHQVFTGVTLIWYDADGQRCQISFAEKTEVVFYRMSEEEIETYVATGECDDKAGSYGIQGLAMKYIEKIDGDYHNVVGLPVGKLYQVMRSYGLIS